MNLKKVPWIAKDGSIFADQTEIQFNTESKVRIDVRPAIAFNLVPGMAEYIVRIHNTAIGVDLDTSS